MLRAYAPILILLGISLLNALGMVVASHLISPYRPTPAKDQPYESGMIPLGSTRERFSVKFYLVALVFIVFDMEAVFLIPWAVAIRELGWSGFVGATIFIVVLTVGLIYDWKKGALQWD
ncbi:MAG: NADH-quinone oxidoreductase subunit A [Longimicrobiales bacterium]